MIGTRILNLLYTHNISQKQLAIDLKIAPTTLNGYVNNRREPDFSTLIDIAKYFHVSCDYLLGNDENSIPSKKPIDLQKQELLLIQDFQNLNDEQKELLLALAKLMNRQNAKKSD